MNSPISYVLIEPVENKTKVHYLWTTYFADEKEVNKTNCWIPGFDLSFCAPNKEVGNEKSKAIMKIFMSHFLDQPRGVRALALELHKLGFKANHDNQTMTDLVRDRVVKAKFSNNTIVIPHEFSDSDKIENELEFNL